MREATEKLIEYITNAHMNSLLISIEKHTLKTGVAEYSWPIQHFWVHLKSFNFSCFCKYAYDSSVVITKVNY